MDLDIKNPIAFFDLETTGINPARDRIVEISILKVDPSGREDTLTLRINPEMPIPGEATAIHGISDDDVKDEPTFREVAKRLAKYLEGCDLGGYNCNKFDIPLLAEEFLRVDVDFNIAKRKVIDVQVIFHKQEQRTLSAAYKFYCSKELHEAHSAEADTRATYEVLKSQLDRYDDLENDIQFLSTYSSHTRNVDLAGRIVLDNNDVEIFNFGKHKGQPVEKILKEEPGYFNWILNGDFPRHTKKVLTDIKLRTFGEKK